MTRALVLLLGLAAACGGKSEPSPPPEQPAALGSSLTPARKAEAEALIARFECTRCHDGTPVAAAAHDQHCVTCHREIRAGAFEAAPEDLARWQGNVKSLLVVPSLGHVGVRLRRAWVQGFLQRPVDVRPHLPASMPRLAIGAGEAALIAEYLVPVEKLDGGPEGADAVRGGDLFKTKACGGCHAVGAVAAAANATMAADTLALAPDLGMAAARLQPGRVVAWIRDPAAMAPGTPMPDLGIDERDGRDLAAYLLSLEPPTRPLVVAEARLPLLTRPVEFAEVAERVFRKVCWHCHSAPHYALGDGGPGNTGGFGFAPRGLDLSTPDGVSSGSVGGDGRRRGVFAPLSDGTPRLIAHLLARRIEERGGEVAGVRGMPLGLPALSLEDLQLVESWNAQGRPE